MIKTKKDLKFYLKEDKKRHGLPVPWYIGIWIGVECCHAYRMVRYLRLYEYALNNSNSLFGKIRYIWRKLRFKQLSFKYRIYLKPNSIGYGFRIVHFGGGVIVNCKCMGNYCGVSSGVIVGNKDVSDAIPTIGNNVALTIGCKIIGRISIGNNVIVAPNSVVVKDVPSDVIVTGIPAKILKFRK